MSEAILLARIARLERDVETLRRRRNVPIGQGRSTLAPDDTGTLGNVQLAQAILDGVSVRDGIPVQYHYGYSANPPVGAEYTVVYLDNDRSKAVIIATSHQQFRMTNLAPGEVAISDLTRGHIIRLGAAGISILAGNAPVAISGASAVNITSSGAVSVTAPSVAVSGSMTVGGNLAVTGDVTAANIEG